MTTSYALNQVRNFRACGAGVPRSLELDAVVETVTCGWDFNSVLATAEHGVCDADRDAIREIIEEEGLSISPEAAEAALIEWCHAGVADAGWVPHRAEVQKILAAYFHDPEDYWDGEERRYELTWETEYDEDGYCVNDIVEELREVLPPGWEAEWTGDTSGDAEDFHVTYVGAARPE